MFAGPEHGVVVLAIGLGREFDVIHGG
jgi:hypothetical protein